MTGTPLHELSIAEAGRKLRDGSLTSLALTHDALARIASIDPSINSFITVTEQRALADAHAADAAFARGEDKGPMQGVPYALKDIYDTAGIRTTCHSKLRADHLPRHDCAVEEKLRGQGGVLLGKLATHEFALGGPSFDLPFPPARNPWNTDHTTGGSSSGSGAAVAAGLVRIAMGTDTGGSIRGPAALCGTVGVKPTFGRVSRRGVFPLAYSLDHAGPLAWSVEDAAIALNAIAGFDPRDQGSSEAPVPDFRAMLDHGVKGLRIGVPRHFFATAAGVSREVVTALDAAAQTLARLGAIVEDVHLPEYELFAACGRVIMFTEAFAIHQKDFQQRPLDFGLSTYSRMVMGAFVTGPDLVQAHRLRRELTHAVTAMLCSYDALLTACTIAPAPLIEAPRDRVSDSPTQSMPFNVTGHPALSIPTGFSSGGLPLSMQLAGRHFDEATILRIAAAFEAQSGLKKIRPALADRNRC